MVDLFKASSKALNNSAPIQEGLVLYLPLWSSYLSGAAFDSIDPYHHLCTVTGATYGSTGRTFDGTDDNILISDVSAFTSDTSGTIICWAYGYQAGYNTLVSFSDKDTTGQNEFQAAFHSGGTIKLICNKGGVAQYELTSGSGLGSTTFYHFAFVSNGTAISMYIDGVSQTVNVTSGSNNGDWVGDMSNVDNLSFGRLYRPTPVSFHQGTQGGALYYNRALTAGEISGNYNQTRGRYQ